MKLISSNKEPIVKPFTDTMRFRNKVSRFICDIFNESGYSYDTEDVDGIYDVVKLLFADVLNEEDGKVTKEIDALLAEEDAKGNK
jgi:hypothetical protein